MANPYNFEGLGWSRFQNLVNVILRRRYPKLETFREGQDGGADGIVRLDNDRKLIIQSKFKSKGHTTDPKVFSQIKAILLVELKKPELKDQATSGYHFVTNYPLSKDENQILRDIVKEKYPGFDVYIWGRSDLELALDHETAIRFPELLNYSHFLTLFNADLDVKEKAYAEELKSTMETFVSTGTFRKAIDILEAHNFVIFSGPPKAGKTFNAEGLAYTFFLQGFKAISVSTPDELYRACGLPGKTIMVCDDIFGDIAHKDKKSDIWVDALKTVVRSLNGDKKLIWTSRNYIWTEVLGSTKISEYLAKHKIEAVEVHVEDLTLMEKAQIVKRHFDTANLSDEEKTVFFEVVPHIVKHPNFKPESIRQLASDRFSKFVFDDEKKDALRIWQKINAFLKLPEESWVAAYKKCNESEKYFLSNLLMSPTNDFDTLKEVYEDETLHNKSLLSFEDVVARLDKFFIRIRSQGAGTVNIHFYHPSLKDVVLAAINSEKKSRQSAIPKLDFGDLSAKLFPALNSYRRSSEDSSEAHRIEFRTVEEQQLARRRFVELMPSQSLESICTVLENGCRVLSVEIELIETTLKYATSREFYVRRADETLYKWRRYFSIIEFYVKKGMVEAPSFCSEFSNRNKLEARTLVFWELVENMNLLNPEVSEKMIALVDLNDLEDDFEDRVREQIKTAPEKETPIECLDADEISDWADETDDILRMMEIITDFVDLPTRMSAIQSLIEDLEYLKDEIPDPNEVAEALENSIEFRNGKVDMDDDRIRKIVCDDLDDEEDEDEDED